MFEPVLNTLMSLALLYPNLGWLSTPCRNFFSEEPVEYVFDFVVVVSADCLCGCEWVGFVVAFVVVGGFGDSFGFEFVSEVGFDDECYFLSVAFIG